MTKKITFLITAALMLLTMMASTGTMWGQTPVTLVSGSGTSGYSIPDGWTSSGTVEGGSYLKFDNGTITSPSFDPHTGLSFTYTVATFGSGTNHPLTIRILNAETDAVITELTTATPTSSSYISTNSPLDLGDVYVAFKIQMYAPTGKGVRLRNYSITGTPYSGSGDLEDSDLAITNQSSDLVFDLYDNATAQTINYTTSSTGAITITPTTSEYFSYVHNADNRTITVTPTAVTPSAQTVTINQAADDTYKAGSVSFTVSITNSAPQYTVTYKANGGTGDDIPVQYYAGDDVTVAENTFTYAGHAFTKWNTNKVGTGTDYLPNATIEDIQADIDLYAQWEESNETIDVLNLAFTGVSGGSGYSAWSNKQGTSGAIYSGKSAGGSSTSNPSIQLRTSGNDCGIVTTTSAGNVTKVELTWNSSTSGRTLDIYGKNTAYSSAADLYSDDSNTQGTKLGSITEGNNQPTYINISGNYSYIGLRSNNNAIYINEIKITWVPDTDPAVATTVTIDATGITNTDVYTSNEAGSLSATVHAGETLIDGASVTWESSNTDAATIDENGVVTLVAAGQTTITASYAGVANTYKPSSATYNLTVINSNVPGSQNHPYTVAQARAAIDAGTGITGVYVTGIISQVDSYNSSYHSITYWISGDGTTTSDQLEIYSGKGLNNTNFSSIDDVAVGATVVVYGTLKKYNEVYEFDYNNYLTSYTAPVVTVEAPTFSPAAGTYDEAQSVTLSCTTEGSTIYYTTDGTNPTNESTEYTAAINVESTTTIKAIAYVGDDYSNVATATYTITSLNNISDITEVGTAYSVKGTVVAINNKGLIIGDGTGYVYYYKNGSVDQSIGDMIKISGNTVTYGQIIQFTSATPNTATVTEATNSNYNGTPEATTITAVPDYSEGYHLSTYLEFEGALEKSGSNYLITVGEGENNQIQISYPTTAQGTALTALDGKTVHIKGYFSGINSSSKFTVMLGSAEEVLVPSITLTPSVINEAPADGGSGEITVTCANMGENPVLSIEFCDANGDPAEYDWISAMFNDTYTKITGTFTENTTTEPRTAHLKVYGTVPNSTTIVYSDIFSITQLAPAGPSIVFETASMSLIAGGESDRQLSFDYSGLGNNPTFSINYYEQDGTTAATYNHDWLTATFEDNKVNISAVANTGEARTAYFKVFAMGDQDFVYSNLVTINQAAYVVDYAELPFEWEGGSSADFAALNGVTLSGNGSDYNNNHAPYLIKLDGDGDYIMVKTNSQPGIVTIGVKMIGGGNTSMITVQGSADGTTFTDVESLTISGAQNDILTLTTTNSFAATDRFVRLYFTKGSNVGVGPITIAQVDHTPSISADNVDIAYDATGGSISYTINNVVSGGTLTASTESDWLTLSTEFASPIQFTCNANKATSARTATVTLTYIYNAKETVTKNVTVTQAAAPAPTFTVSFAVGDGGTFVPNTDFPTVEESKPAGTYTLPSATKEGYTFTGWNDGTTTYAGGAEYTVSADVTFTAQWTEIPAGATYTLVETDNDIVPGQHYIIVGIGGTDSKYYAMGSQNTNYRNRVEVTANGTTIAYIEGVYEVVLSGYRDNTTNTWTIYDEVTVVDEHTGGYLYASGTGSSNYLSTQVTNSDRGQWSISINAESHKATIQANTTATERKILKYNHNSSRFSCYSGGQQDIYLYKKNNDKTYNFYSNTTVASLTVANDGACIVHEDVALNVTGTITNNGGADNLLIKDGGQLIHNNAVNATLQKDITAWTTKDVGGWYFIASPVDGAAIDESFDQTAIDLFKYDEPDAYWYSYLNNGHNQHPFSTLTRGVGYLHASESIQTVEFAGMMVRTDEPFSLPLSYACTYDDVKGFNLVGNPYTCNIMSGNMLIGSTPVLPIYVINDEGRTKLTAVTTDTYAIKPGEGFFVQATDSDQTLTMNTTTAKDKFEFRYIKIVAGNENGYDNAFIQLEQGNTLRKMDIAETTSVYVMNDGDDYAAARVEELAGTMPVHFKAVEDGEFTITINAKNIEASTMMLFDNQTGELIDLLETPTYAFKASAEDEDNRFKLIFDFNNNYNGVDDNYVNGNFAYQNGDELFVSGDGTLQVFDVMGRFVMSKEIHGSESVSVSAFETGVYMLRFVGENIMTQKIVVR